MELRDLSREEIPLIWTIDRSEVIDNLYVLQNGALVLKPGHFDAPGWPPGAAEISTPRFYDSYDRGGDFHGAFDGERLAGVAIVDTMRVGVGRALLQLLFLHVGRAPLVWYNVANRDTPAQSRSRA